jgi:hypothetical protein
VEDAMSHLAVIINAWNTDNPYTVKGQRIGYCVFLDNSIIFSDVDRMIDGLIPSDFEATLPPQMRILLGYMHTRIDYGNHNRFPFQFYSAYRTLASHRALEL